VFGGDSIPNTISNLHAVREEDEVLRPTSSKVGLGRAMSTRSLGLRAEVPHSVDTARSSMATLNMVPPSAASTATLFEFEAGLESGPQAQSTPHNGVSQKSASRQPPLPLPLPNHITTSQPPQSGRSSIVYIRSDDNASPTIPTVEPATASSMSSFAQWSSRAVRPLIPKASRLQRKMSNAISSPSDSKPGSPGGGLRPLSLLQDRDTNINMNANSASSVTGGTRPLTLGKRQKPRMAVSVRDENADPDARSKNRNLKPLHLARSETSKMRGILRKEEVLPDVVVRPPSATEHTGFAYSFRD